jgi:RNA polymerase sigma-70 factor (ECF subfamily)
MLTDDVVISMPPEPLWLTGPGPVGAFLRERRARRPGPWRFVATVANGQPAYAYYLTERDEFVRSGLLVFGVRADGIESVTRFRDRGLLDRFGVPRRLPAA